MTGAGPVLRAMLGLADVGEREVAGRMCQACVRGTDVDGAALSLMTASASHETVAATDATAATVEDLQFTLGEGACIDAALSGRPVLVPDIHEHVLSAHWPMFAAAVAEETGVRALFALPLQLGAITVGVIDLYRDTPGPLRAGELRDVAAAVDAATLLMLGVPARSRTGRPVLHGGHVDADGGEAIPGDGARWDGLWSDYAEVHQATGMVLVQLGVPAQEAFVRLRAHAFATHRRLADIARDVVARRLVFTEDVE